MSATGTGMGVVGLGVIGKPAPFHLRPDLCGAHGHPAVTYNPWSDESWCLCGRVREPGDTVRWPKADGIDGVLREGTPC